MFADVRESFFSIGEIIMNACRKIACVLGLLMALASVGLAQGVAQKSAAMKMDSCCCCGDSCDTAKKDAMKNHVTAADKDSCCACCGDSCDMKKKDEMKKHVTAADKDGCCACCGDSCDMKKKDAMKNHVTSSDKDKCCCGDSCDMKTMKDTKRSEEHTSDLQP